MAKARTAPSVLLAAALLGADEDLLRRARQLLVRRYGPLADEVAPFPSADGSAYEHQMGGDLRRGFLLFAEPVRPKQLPDLKLETNALETQVTEDALLIEHVRAVNVDPCYVTPRKLVRATMRDTDAAVYIDCGVYGEVLLTRREGAWQPLPHAPADFAAPAVLALWDTASRVLASLSAERAGDGATEPSGR